jgi:hypothetical protein
VLVLGYEVYIACLSSSTYNNESQGLGVDDEPTGDQESHGEQHGHDGEPIPLPPPKGQEEADGKHKTSDLARDNIETAENEQRANEGGAEIASGKGDCAYAADHMRDTSLAGVKRDGLDATTGADGGDGMSKLVEGDDKHLHVNGNQRHVVGNRTLPHYRGIAVVTRTETNEQANQLTNLEGPETPSNIWKIPQCCNHDNIYSDYAQGDLLGVAGDGETTVRQDDISSCQPSDSGAGCNHGGSRTSDQLPGEHPGSIEDGSHGCYLGR